MIEFTVASFSYFGLLTFLAGWPSVSPAAEADASNHLVQPADVIGVLESGGVHPGVRRNHAKGICVAGEFRPSKAAASLSSSNIFAGPSVNVVGRFSNPGPNPKSADNGASPRGLALQFRPRDGDTTNMAMLNVPVFPVPTPEAFYELLTLKGDQLGDFQNKYPRSRPFFAFLGKYGVPESYGSEDYHSLNAFKFTNAKGKATFVRWNFVSQQGNHFLTAEAAKAKSPDFLSPALQSQLAKGPLTWQMQAVLANAGDSLVDPSALWTGPHKTVVLGMLSLTKADADDSGDCNAINFDPIAVAKGIEPSDDPVLKFRSPAYAISFGKRMSEKSQAQ